MCLAQGLQHSDAGEARTRSPSVSIGFIICTFLVSVNLGKQFKRYRLFFSLVLVAFCFAVQNCSCNFGERSCDDHLYETDLKLGDVV